MKTYLELPHMLPITVKSAEGDRDVVWIIQPGDDESEDAVLVHKDQVRGVIEALEDFLAERSPCAPPPGSLPLNFAQPHSTEPGPDVPVVHAGSKTRATRIPAGWAPSAELVAYAEKELPGVDTAKLAEAFVDYWTAAAGEKARKVSWDATWRTWVRRSVRDYPTVRAIGGLVNGSRPRQEPTPEQVDAARRAAIEANRRELERKVGGILRPVAP